MSSRPHELPDLRGPISAQENPATYHAYQAALRAVLTSPAVDCGFVLRTQRIVRERALKMEARRRRLRAILAACIVCSAFLAIVAVPLWTSFDDLAHWSGIPDLQIQMLFLALWFLPATMVVVVMRKRRGEQRFASLRGHN